MTQPVHGCRLPLQNAGHSKLTRSITFSPFSNDTKSSISTDSNVIRRNMLSDVSANVVTNQRRKSSEPKIIMVAKSANSSRSPRGSRRSPIKFQNESKQRPPCARPSISGKGCRLQDLCDADRSKLARLIYELAETQQQLTDMQQAHAINYAHPLISKDVSSVAPRELSCGRTTSPDVHPESSCNCSNPHSEEGATYRSRLANMETELQAIRSLLTRDAVDEHKSILHVKPSIPASVCTTKELTDVNHRLGLSSMGNSVSNGAVANEQPQDGEVNPGDSLDASAFASRASGQQRTRDASVNVTPRYVRMPRETRLYEHDSLLRQHQVLSVIAKQQAQLQQLSAQLQAITSSVFSSKDCQLQPTNLLTKSITEVRPEEPLVNHDAQATYLPNAISPVSNDQHATAATSHLTADVKSAHQRATPTVNHKSTGVMAHITPSTKVSFVQTTGVQAVTAPTRDSESHAWGPEEKSLKSHTVLEGSITANTPLEVLVDTSSHLIEQAQIEDQFGVGSGQKKHSIHSLNKDSTDYKANLDDVQKILTLIEDISFSSMAPISERFPPWRPIRQVETQASPLPLSHQQQLPSSDPVLDLMEEQLLNDLFFIKS